ncbi:MAG: cation-transporting P-type ATPase [Candidatus Nanoarchaeia archaeon]|nr:cation-transporting P-type ATPase [Candidatus Nanoarchaeia archaeon]
MNERGLTSREAKRKLAEFGYNELKETRLASPFQIFLRQIKGNFMIYFLLAAMILSFLVGKAITAYTILGDVILVIVVGFVQEYKAEKVIKSLRSMIMPVSIVIRDGVEKEVPSKELVTGDIVVLRQGEKIPADCFILEEKNIMTDESILTGESKPVEKSALRDDKYADRNMLFMGTFIVNGRCVAQVSNTGMNTKFGQISSMISTAEKELPLQKKMNKITRFIAIVAVAFSLLTGTFMLLGKPITQNLFFDAVILFIALTVSAFPEGFPVVMITALSSGAYRMAKKNAIVNRMSIIETLGDTTVICSDKTGTITKGEMTVRKIFADGRIFDVSGVGYKGEGKFCHDDEKINPGKESVLDLLLKASVMCNDANIQRTGEDKDYHVLGTPTEGALLIAASKAEIYSEDLKFSREEEIPFSSERKIMSVLCSYNREKYVFSKGASEILIQKCKFIQRHDGIFRITEKEREKILEINRQMNSRGLRTLGIACKKVKTFEKDHFEEDLVLLGIAGMEDPPREEVRESIQLCLNSGIKVKMITGDNRETAIAIASQIGLRGRVLEGKQLDTMTEQELARIVDTIVIFSRVRPEHKLKIVKALKINGEIVTMTGDGVNDAPALKESHIGVAMGKTGTDVSREVSDLILKDDNFATIVEAIKEGRTIFKNIRKFVSYQLSCSYAELFIVSIGLLLAPLFGWQVPLLLAMQILFMNLVTDDFPAIMLSLTPASLDVMEEKPRKKREILNKSLVIWFVIAGFFQMSLTILAFYLAHNVLGQSFEAARTTAMLTLIIMQITNAYNFVSFRRAVNLKTFIVNKYLFWASVISLTATAIIIYTPVNIIFETAPVSFTDWLIAMAAGLIIILVFNLLKYLNKKKKWFELEHF